MRPEGNSSSPVSSSHVWRIVRTPSSVGSPARPAALRAPTEHPMTTSGVRPASSRAWSIPTWMDPRFPPPPRTKAVRGAGCGNSRTDIREPPPSTWSAWNAPQTMAQSDHLPSRSGLVGVVNPIHDVPAAAYVLHVQLQRSQPPPQPCQVDPQGALVGRLSRPCGPGEALTVDDLAEALGEGGRQPQ